MGDNHFNKSGLARRIWVGLVLVGSLIATSVGACASDSGKGAGTAAQDGATHAPTKERLENSVRSYTKAYLGNSPTLAAAYLSARCKQLVDQEEFAAAVQVASTAYPSDRFSHST